MRDEVQEVENAGERAAALTNQVLALRVMRKSA